MQDEETVEIHSSQLSSLKQFTSFFKKGKIEDLATESGFISCITSRLSGEMFLKMLNTHISASEVWSLKDQCQYLKDEFKVELTKQSLDKHYQTFAVRFLKSVTINCY